MPTLSLRRLLLGKLGVRAVTPLLQHFPRGGGSEARGGLRRLDLSGNGLRVEAVLHLVEVATPPKPDTVPNTSLPKTPKALPVRPRVFGLHAPGIRTMLRLERKQSSARPKVCSLKQY